MYKNAKKNQSVDLLKFNLSIKVFSLPKYIIIDKIRYGFKSGSNNCQSQNSLPEHYYNASLLFKKKIIFNLKLILKNLYKINQLNSIKDIV